LLGVRNCARWRQSRKEPSSLRTRQSNNCRCRR
jgi:hypothetical protein